MLSPTKEETIVIGRFRGLRSFSIDAQIPFSDECQLKGLKFKAVSSVSLVHTNPMAKPLLLSLFFFFFCLAKINARLLMPSCPA
jgi:hypothetical protein